MNINITINLQKQPNPDDYVQSHIHLGFLNAPCVIEYYDTIKKYNKNKDMININNDKIEKYNYYKKQYPNYTFIHKDDINIYFKKYKIIENKKYSKNIPIDILQKIKINGNIKNEDIKENELELVVLEDYITKGLYKKKVIYSTYLYHYHNVIKHYYNDNIFVLQNKTNIFRTEDLFMFYCKDGIIIINYV